MSLLPPDCEQQLIAGYVLGDLSSTEAALFEEILAAKPELAQQIAELQQALTLTYEFPEILPPRELRTKILAAHERSRTTQIHSHPDLMANISFILSTKFPWGKVLGAVAAAAVMGLSVANYRLWQTLQQTSLEAPESQQLVYTLQSTEEATAGAKVNLAVNPDKLEGTLSVNNLTPLPPDLVYVLWTVVGNDAPFTTDEKGAILTEVFQVNDEGNLSRNIVVPEAYRTSQTIKKLAVTIEKRAAPQAHKGSILLVTDETQDTLRSNLKTKKRRGGRERQQVVSSKFFE